MVEPTAYREAAASDGRHNVHWARYTASVTPYWLIAVAVWGACGGGDDGASDSGDLVDAAPSPWQALPDVGGGPIQEIGVAELDGMLYVIGGFDAELSIVPDVRVHDIAAGTWGSAAPLPVAVHHANVAAANGRLYVLGALTAASFRQTGASWQYDPVADRWDEVLPMDDASARGAAAVGVIDGVVYLAGGFRNGEAVDLVSSYDPASNQWKHDHAPLPAPRDHLAGAAVDGLLYAISGRDGGVGAVTARVDAYDPVADAWTPRAPIPTPRGGMASALVSGRIVVVGGEGSDVLSGVFSEVESYDPVRDEWTALAPMRTPRHGMGAAGTQGVLYVPGGATARAFAPVATFEALPVEL